MPQFLPFAATGENGDPNFPDNTPLGGGGSGALQAVQRIGQTNLSQTAVGTVRQQISDTYNWTVPEDIFNIQIIMAGGGASGAGQSNGNTGGAAGAVFIGNLLVVPGQTYAINVGQGSFQTDGGNNFQQPGGNSSIVGSATALIDGVANVTIEAGGAPRSSSQPNGGVTYTNYSPVIGDQGDFGITRISDNSLSFAYNPLYGKLGAGIWASLGILSPSGTSGGANLLNGRQSQPTAQSSGGAGFLEGEVSSVNSGFGRAGGPGGVRIGWFSNDQLAVNNQIV